MNHIEETIDLMEAELLNKIFSLIAKGLSIAAIATTLAIPQDVVQAAVRKAPTQRAVLSLSDVDKLARTIYAEAEGESYQGKLAVASVIYNRAKGDTTKMVRVVTARKQFSCWDARTPVQGKGQAWEDCLEIAQKMIDGSFQPSINANHYFNPKKCSPSWAYLDKAKTRPRPKVASIGNHVFLNINETLLCSFVC